MLPIISLLEKKMIDGGIDANTANTFISISDNSQYSQNVPNTIINATEPTSRVISAGSYANSAFIKVNSAYALVNTTLTIAQASFDASNNSSDVLGMQFANSASLYANSAFSVANTASISAQAAFNKANAGFGTVTSVSGTGTVNGLTLTGSVTTSGSLTLGGTLELSSSGNLTFTDTSNRILGDFSNDTIANRVAFQTSTPNNETAISVIPNGSSNTSHFQAYNNSNPTNASFIGMSVVGTTDTRITSANIGSGSLLPMTFYTGGSERMRIDTNGNVGIGSTPRAWGSGTKALQIGSAGTLSGDGFGASYLSSNSYFDGSSWIRINSFSNPTVYSVGGGLFTWRIGPSGTTGTASTLVGVMELNSNGLTIGDIFTPNSGNLLVREQLTAGTIISNGNITGQQDIYAYGNIIESYSSDRRLKENIQDVNNALDKVCAIGSKTFDWTDEYLATKGGEDGYLINKSDFGVIAQDVQEVFPQAVITREDGTLAVDYKKLATLAFGAIKELAKRVEALEVK
jgi:hypothetical protein